MRDANFHFVNNSTSYDYIQSDDTHPTYNGNTIYVGLFGGTGSGSGAPEYTSFPDGKNPIWDQYGHERMGFALSEFSGGTPPSTTTTTTLAPPTTTTTLAPPTTTTTLPSQCIADGAGGPCGASTDCCSGNCNTRKGTCR